MSIVGTKQTSGSFYVAGGTLSRDARCYVERQADQDLYESCRQGKFCYVLTARQMGKSSLMVRTAARLREERVGVAVLDLTALGQNLSAEQWYGGLLTQMGDHLDLLVELEEFWREQAQLGPLQRWMQSIRKVVLPHYLGPVAVFVDEIDVVRSLPFSTDEFFAGIRELHNARSEDAELERLTFCLLGVAAPSDLIRDTRMTPFNIGQRIELHDFTEAEAGTLAHGLGPNEPADSVVLKRIFYWTGGHPYLTQRLCQSVVEEGRERVAEEVDRLCQELFLSAKARERDDNLIFVRERLLRSEVDVAGLLNLYDQVHRGRPVKDDPADPLISVLRLSGIGRVEDGLLKVRNRTYELAFDREWIKESMPDAEVRRQRAAYRKGVLRTAAVATFIVAAIAILAFVAVRQLDRADAQHRRAESLRRELDELREIGIVKHLPNGWFPAGSHPQNYDMGVDRSMLHTGKASGHIAAKRPDLNAFGTLMQDFSANAYRGKRIRMSGFVKCENVEHTALWMRVDGERRTLAFDNMDERPIRGTLDWKRYEIVLDVPENSIGIYFGILLGGKGQAWVDDLNFELVSEQVATTGLWHTYPKQDRDRESETSEADLQRQKEFLSRKPAPINLDFETLP